MCKLTSGIVHPQQASMNQHSLSAKRCHAAQHGTTCPLHCNVVKLFFYDWAHSRCNISPNITNRCRTQPNSGLLEWLNTSLVNIGTLIPSPTSPMFNQDHLQQHLKGHVPSHSAATQDHLPATKRHPLRHPPFELAGYMILLKAPYTNLVSCRG